jgi:hypothetical protein
MNVMLEAMIVATRVHRLSERGEAAAGSVTLQIYTARRRFESRCVS